jgi:hypothetical protein
MPEHQLSLGAISYVNHNPATGEKSILVPVPAHVRHFLLKEYAGGAKQIHARQNQFIGAVVVAVCEKAQKRRIRSEKRTKTTTVKIVLPYDLKYAHVSAQTIADLSVILEKLFFDKFVSFVLCGSYINRSERGAADLFLQLYDINPDHWDIDAAYACWKRYKEDITIKKAI